MRNFLSLLKLQINARFGISYAGYTFKNDKKALLKAIGLGLVILFAFAEIIGLYTFLIYQLYKAASSINAPQIIITVASIVTGLVVLFFGIFYILGALFLAKDTEFLTSLPMSQGIVFLSKFILVLIGEYPFALFLMLPPVIIYGAGEGKGVLYYILAVVCTMFVPLVPLIISALLSLILMNIVSRSRRRDLITVIGSIILMIIVIGGQSFLASRVPENEQEFMSALLKSSNVLVEFMGRVFPPAVWITKILSSGGAESALNLGLLVLVSLAAFALVYLLASFIYQRGATAQLETARSRPGSIKLGYHSSSQVIAIFKNEWRIILRSPVYALNSLVVIVMAPLLLIMPMFGGNFANDPDMKFLFDLINSGESRSELLLIVAGIITALALINPAISTTISREGANLWVIKNIPVNPETIIRGKLLAGYSISFIAAVLAALAVMLSLKLSPFLTFMIVVLSALALIPISAVSLLIDLIRPKLSWSSEQEAIKQNMNSLYGMLLGFLIISVLGVAAYLLNTLGLNVYAMFGIMLLILLTASYVSLKLLFREAGKGLYRLEI